MYNKDFLGKGWKFPLEIDPRTGHFAMSSHEDNIRESIEIIINTFVGERVMRPDFGSNAIDYVFAIDRDFPTYALAYELQKTLIIQEPRIDEVDVTSDKPSVVDGSIVINVAYTVRSTNNRYNQVYPFFMKGVEEIN